VLTGEQIRAYIEEELARGPGWRSPNHHAARDALRHLGGRHAGPAAGAWRTMLDLPEVP
jgi:hypothetical protein